MNVEKGRSKAKPDRKYGSRQALNSATSDYLEGQKIPKSKGNLRDLKEGGGLFDAQIERRNLEGIVNLNSPLTKDSRPYKAALNQN